MCVYLGVSPTYKAHNCINMERGIFISKDVAFNENEFPFKTSFQIGDHSGSTPQIQLVHFPNILL